MKKKLRLIVLAFAMFAIIAISVLLFSGCDSLLLSLDDGDENDIEQVQVEFFNLPQFSFPNDLTFPVVMHYGANIGFFPPKARDWIINEAFTIEKMERAYMRNSSLKALWSDDNNVILFEASYTIAPGYVGAGTRETWGTEAKYHGGTTIFDTYGEYAYYQTLRFKYEYELYMEYLLE
ncbi:MAG: hypothetical protein FWC03_11260, partial [Treponema sp.]|nr:hypothetical protein [Treponema sp.]